MRGGGNPLAKISSKNEGFVYSYGWNRVMMYGIGGWPEDNENLFMRNRVFLNAFILLLFVILPGSASVPVLWGDLDVFVEILSLNVSVSLAFVKCTWLGIQRHTVDYLLKRMAEDWLVDKTLEEHEDMMEMTKIIRFISALSFYGTLSLFATFISLQIPEGLGPKNDTSVDPRLSQGFLYYCSFPFETSSLLVFIPIWIGQFFASYVSLTGYSSPDSFLGMFVFHQCGQLKILRRKLEKIGDSARMDKPQDFWKKLGDIVERHEHLNERSSIIEENFNKLFLAGTIVSIFATCTQVFGIISLFGSGADFPVVHMLFLCSLAVYDMGHFFVYCLAGDVLLTESSNFGASLYNSAWYNLPANEAKSILIFTSRCTLPQRITGGKFTVLSLPLFKSVIKTSASYLSVLLAVKS